MEIEKWLQLCNFWYIDLLILGGEGVGRAGEELGEELDGSAARDALCLN